MPSEYEEAVSHLTPDERRKLSNVLERDLALQKQEQRRVELERLTVAVYVNESRERQRRQTARKAEAAAGWTTVPQLRRRCARCQTQLGYVQHMGVSCAACADRVCTDCARRTVDAEQRRHYYCDICFMGREYIAKSGRWMQRRSVSQEPPRPQNAYQQSICDSDEYRDNLTENLLTQIRKFSRADRAQEAKASGGGDRRWSVFDTSTSVVQKMRKMSVASNKPARGGLLVDELSELPASGSDSRLVDAACKSGGAKSQSARQSKPSSSLGRGKAERFRRGSLPALNLVPPTEKKSSKRGLRLL